MTTAGPKIGWRSTGALALGLAALALGGCGPSAQNKREVESASVRRKLAFSLAAHREWAAATAPLLELRAQNPKDANVHALLGTVYREQGLFEQADASYKAALALDPDNAGAYVGRGILREVRGGGGDGALEDFRAAIKLAPQEAAYHNNLGFALYVRGRYAEAAAALQEGLKHDPFSRRMRNNLGFVYGKLGELDRARREFEHGGGAAEASNNLGLVHEQAGALAAACSSYRDALEKNPLLGQATENAERACATAAPRGPASSASEATTSPSAPATPSPTDEGAPAAAPHASSKTERKTR